MRKPRRTEHQREIMGVILRAAGEGHFLRAAEIYPMMSYAAEVTPGAVRKSLELMEKQGFVERERRGRNVVLVPTERGYNWFRPAAPVLPGASL